MAKGLVGKIYHDGTAVASKSGNIDLFISPTSVLGRKNVSFIKELYLGKLTKSLREEVMKMAKDPKISTTEIIKLIEDYYTLICSENTQKSIEKRFNSMGVAKLRKEFTDGSMSLYTILEPFHDVSFENIKTAAKMLGVALDEKVTTTNEETGEKITSDRAVPVGITYLQFLEHFSSAYSSVGGAVKYNQITKQPVKVGGSQNVGGISQLDINAFLTMNIPSVVQELLTARSDHHKLKRSMYTQIKETGELFEPTKEDDELLNKNGGTSNLKNLYLNGMGLMTH